MATTTNSASISTINVSTPNHTSNASSTPCSIQASCFEDEDREPNDQAQEWVIGVMLTLCAVGIIINCIGLFVLYLSFAFKSGSVFLEMLGIFDIMTCMMVIPFEVYGILKIETVNVPGGACMMLSILDSWISFSTLLSVLAASIYILGRCTRRELHDVKRKNWSHSVGVIMLLSLLLAAIMWMARPNGIKFYEKSKNTAKSALARMSCIFREGALLETAGIAATTIVSIRLGVLVFIAVTMGAAFVAFYRQQKRQKGEISSGKTAPGLDEVDLSHRPSYMCQPINHGRLMDAVSTVVYEGLEISDLEESTAIVEWVADTMSEDQKLIDAVIQCYFYGEWRDHSSQKPSTHQPDPLPDVSSTGGPALLKPPPMSTGGPALLKPPPRSTGCVALFKPPPMTTGCSSLLNPPPMTTGCSSLLKPPQTMIAPKPDQHRDSITDPVGRSEMSSRSSPAGTPRRFLTFGEQAKHADDHDSDRRARPGLDTEEDPVGLHGIRSSMDMHLHSALTYMYVTGEQQVAVRREMIYQRALNRLMRSGYSVNSAAVSTLTLNNPRASASDSCLQSNDPMMSSADLDYTRSTYQLPSVPPREMPVSQLKEMPVAPKPETVVDESIMVMSLVAAILVLVSLFPVSVFYFTDRPRRDDVNHTPNAVFYNYLWTEIYFLHAMLKPVFYFIASSKFRFRCLKVVCHNFRWCKNRLEARKIKTGK